MARIDVSELMVDPDFISPISIVRRTATVNTYGENVLANATPLTVVGSVQSVGRNTLKRLPDGALLQNWKTVYCKTPLYADVASGYADQVIFEGLTYNVKNVLPWGNFGAGWYECDIELEKASL